MGNSPGKLDENSLHSTKKTTPLGQRRFVKFLNGNKLSSFEISASDTALQSRIEHWSFSSNKSNPSFSSVTRPWSRVSRKKWTEKTLSNPLSLSKTAWPVPFFESLFLPEFKIRDDVTENSFEILEPISSGAFSNVYKVLKKDTEKIYAMKVLSKAQLVASNLINQVKEEVKIQKMVGHNPFIVGCPYHWQSRKRLYIISEYVSGGELFTLLQEKKRLPLDVVRFYIAELALALDFLHNAGIIYRDLKLENVLLNSDGHIQLIDFGLSKWLKYGMRTNTICGTLQYIAPEVLQQKPYGHAVDWWSLGIILVYMSSGQCPYECCLDENGSLRCLPEFASSPEIKDLTSRLLAEDPVQRLRSLSALKRTSFFMGFDFDNVFQYRVDLGMLTDCSHVVSTVSSSVFGGMEAAPGDEECDGGRLRHLSNMSLMGQILHKKNRHRRRPFSIEEKAREGRATATAAATTTGEANEDRYCRICFDDKKKESPITPCRCKGTIGLVHMSCLEKWLSMSNTHSCELCGYNFQTLRTPKYRVLYSIYYWVFLDRNPQYHRGLKSDFIVFIVLTPIALIGIYSCIVAADFYSKEPSKYSPASRWTTVSLLIMVVLLTFAYYLWVAVTIRFHMRIWYIWWQANNIVKVMPRDPNSNSLERLPLSIHSSDSRQSAVRSIREATVSRTNSLRETQALTPTTQDLSV